MHNLNLHAHAPPFSSHDNDDRAPSTVKPFLGIAALMFGVRDVDETTWCKGWYTLKGHDHRYRDWKRGGAWACGFELCNYAVL